MVQSQNTKVDLTIRATSYHGISTYGDMMVGDKAVEFYNEKNKADFIQIPWNEVDQVAASVIFGKFIPRFVVMTKQNGNYSFSTRDNKKTLCAMRPYVGEDNLVRSPSFFGVLKLGIQSLFRIGKKKA